MENESAVSFDDLVAYRQQLQKFCSTHYKSLIEFRHRISFKLNLGEGSLGKTARHLSSTATCIESLLDCVQSKTSSEIATLAKEFAVSAMRRGKWLSDGSAPIY